MATLPVTSTDRLVKEGKPTLSPVSEYDKHLIVVPAYNEAEALPATLLSLQTLPEGFEVLVVNDGSTDRTGAIAEAAAGGRIPVHVIHLPLNCGIGVAVQSGYLFAAQQGCYEYVFQFDGDGQHDARDIPALLEACLRAQLDLCIGSRFLLDDATGFRSTVMRRLGIRFFCLLIGAFSGVRVTDPTSGFRCAGPRAWKRFARHYPEDYPEPEALFWCVRSRLQIGEVPVHMHPRQGGTSSIKPWRSFYYMFKVTLAILLDRLRGKEI